MRVIVIGAGFAGLAAADALARRGAEVVVLEARDRVGGRVWSVPFAGAIVERGAEFVLPGNELVRATAARLGLRLFEKGTPYGDREPRLGRPLSAPALAAALDRLRAAAPPAAAGSLADALAEIVDDRAAREAIEARIEVSSAYPASDLEASVLAEGAAGFGGFASHSVEGGNDRIARRLAEGLGARLRLRSPVRRLAWAAGGVVAGLDDGSVEAEAAVLAVPAPATLAVRVEPALPQAKHRALAGVRYGQAAKLFLPLRGEAAPSATLAVPHRFWSYTQRGADGRPLPVLASFAGTPAAVERLAADPAAWAELVRRLRPELDLDAGPLLLSTWHDDPWALGAYSARARSSPLADAALAAPVGPLAFAGEHTAGAWHGLMEGALRSGERAAAEVLARRSAEAPG